jgi:hypothetical protein
MEAKLSRQALTPTSPMVLEQRLFVRIHRSLAGLSHSIKLESRNPVRRRRIPAELSHSSYKEGSQHTGRPYGPQSIATLPTKLRLATTLRMGDLQVESPRCGLYSDFHM